MVFLTIVSWENLEGGAESSHHSGAVYVNRVEEYLESQEYLSVGDKHSGTSDLRLTRPAHNEEKVFRVEAKNTKADLKDATFQTEIARHLIDFHIGVEDFELLIFAEDFVNQPRWKDIFRDRTRKRDEVEWFWDKIQQNHNLNDDEIPKFEELEFQDFWEFLEKVGVKKAGYGRLGELIDENKDKKRREKKWEFYIRENKPVQEKGKLLPNFFELTRYPDKVYILPSAADSHRELYSKEGIHSYLPIWQENSQIFTLLGKDHFPDELNSVVPKNSGETKNFQKWVFQNDQNQRIGKILLNRQLLWRGTLVKKHCLVAPDNRKLIFRTRPVQSTLAGDAESQDFDRTEEESYLVTRHVQNAVGHRYCQPRTRVYEKQHYVFLQTGWLFSREGKGQKIITGDWAKRLSDKLREEGYDRHSNYRAQLNAWTEFLRIDRSITDDDHPVKTFDIPFDQALEFRREFGLSTPSRPPKNKEERDALMEGDCVV